MKIDFKTTVIVSCILTVVSCGKPDCVNTNQIFNDYKPELIEYKNEIAELMETDYDKITFWLNHYVKNDKGEFIEIQISGDQICAKAFVRVTDWTKMEGIQKTEGLSFSGAELIGLKFTLEKDSIDSYFLYKDVEKVID